MYRKCNNNITARKIKANLSSVWRIFKKVENNLYILYKFDSGRTVYAPLYVHTFRFLTNRHLKNAQAFLCENLDPQALDTVSDKLKWYRYQNGLQQSDIAKIMEVDRTTYSRYEENVLETYPLDKLEKAAKYFGIDITVLLDEYNLFLYHGQGGQIKGLRKSLGFTQSELAQQLSVSTQKVRNWEEEKVRISRVTFEKISTIS